MRSNLGIWRDGRQRIRQATTIRSTGAVVAPTFRGTPSIEPINSASGAARIDEKLPADTTLVVQDQRRYVFRQGSSMHLARLRLMNGDSALLSQPFQEPHILECREDDTRSPCDRSSPSPDQE